MNESIDGWINEWMNRQIDARINKLMNRYMIGWIDKRVSKWIDVLEKNGKQIFVQLYEL